MIPVCLYFQVHQPYRLRRYNYFDVGREHRYFDDAAQPRPPRGACAERCYLPATAMLERLLERHPRFAVSFSLSGCLLEQLARLGAGRRSTPSGGWRVSDERVEFLAETSHHSLAWLASREEFADAGRAPPARRSPTSSAATPRVFRNTELIYSDALAAVLEERGFTGRPRRRRRAADRAALARATSTARRRRAACRFSCGTTGFRRHRVPLLQPLVGRVAADAPRSTTAGSRGCEGEVLSLFMDFETFGEHQRTETGIFEFFEAWVDRHARAARRRVPDALARRSRTRPRRDLLSAPPRRSPGPTRRGTSPPGRATTSSATPCKRLFALEGRVRAAGSPELLDGLPPPHDLRPLLLHGDASPRATAEVHAYFSPYDSPYEAYIAFMHVLSDLERRLPRPRRRGRVLSRPARGPPPRA